MTVRQLPSTRPCFRRYFRTAGVPPICSQQEKLSNCRTSHLRHSSLQESSSFLGTNVAMHRGSRLRHAGRYFMEAESTL